jgi:hypothetical protein
MRVFPCRLFTEKSRKRECEELSGNPAGLLQQAVNGAWDSRKREVAI